MRFAIAAGAGVLSLPFAFYVRTWRSFSQVVDICPNAFCDFGDYYYPMGDAIFRTGLPVDGFLYSPFNAILMAAFPPLGLDVSIVLWGILQVLFVALFVLLFSWLVPARLPIQLLFAALALTSYPLLLNLMGGQVSVFMFAPLLGALVLYRRGRLAAAAALIALAVSFKFYPIIFLAPFALRRDVRFVLFTVTACGTVLLVIPGLLLGFGDTLRFYGALLDAFRDSGWVVTNPHSQFLPHVVLRLTGEAGYDANTHLPLLRWIAYGIAAANMGLVFLVQRSRLRGADLWSFQIVFLTIPFVLKTSWPHDFAFLSFTQALLAWRLLEGEEAARERLLRGRTAVSIVLLLVSIVFSNVFFFHLVGNFTLYGSSSFLFWANSLLLTALYLQLLPPALRRPHVPPGRGVETSR